MATRGWVLLLSLITIVATLISLAKADVPAIFIFGDSTADVGTNNHLDSLARADHPFNGIDFPYSIPTGRFSNGYNTADLISKLLGFKKSPEPFLTLQQRNASFKSNSLRGVNFASGGSGILNDTGRAFLEVVSLGEQIQQFEIVAGNINETLGPDAANDLLSNALFLISAGSNDIFDYQRSNGGGISTDTLLTNLRDNYTIYLKHLYELGARKFGIISVPPIGCCPFERYANKFLNGGLGCFDEMNQLALAFYSSIEALLREFSTQFPGVKYSLGNTYNMTIPIINNPYTFGFKYAEEACCGSGPFNGQYECNISSNLCPDRKDYLFWDWFHPTQAVSKLAALTLYYGSTDYTSPMNLSQLVLPDI